MRRGLSPGPEPLDLQQQVELTSVVPQHPAQRSLQLRPIAPHTILRQVGHAPIDLPMVRHVSQLNQSSEWLAGSVFRYLQSESVTVAPGDPEPQRLQFVRRLLGG